MTGPELPSLGWGREGEEQQRGERQGSTTLGAKVHAADTAETPRSSATVTSETSARLVGRSDELEELREARRQAQLGRGSVRLLIGPAGIGKTALLDAIASDPIGLVVRVAGGEFEQSHPFGVVAELAEALLARAGGSEELVDAAGPTLSALARGEAPEFSILPPEDARMNLERGLGRLLTRVGEARPGTVVIVDDLHWVDAPSLRALLHAMRGVPRSGLLLLLGARPGEASALAERRASRTLTLRPLPRAAVEELVTRVLPEADDALVETVAHRTGGNPFLATRLVAALQTGEAGSARAAALEATPSDVTALLRAQLEALAPTDVRLARAVAWLGSDAALLRRAAELAGLRLDEATDAWRRLIAADLLTSDDPLTWRHPLIGHAAMATMDEPTRRQGLLAAARLLHAEGARRGTVATLLLDAAPCGEPWAAELLLRAGEDALGQGDPTGASRLLRRATLEADSRELQAQIALPLARAASFANEPDADALLEAALELTEDPFARAVALLDRGDLLTGAGRVEEARRTLDRARAELGGCDAPDELRAFAMLMTESARWQSGVPGGPVEISGDGEQARAAHEIAVATELALTGRGTAEQITELALGALRVVTGIAELGCGFLSTMALGATDELDAASDVLRIGAEWAEQLGSPLETGTWIGAQGIVAGWRGALAEAIRSCEAAIELEAAGWDRHAAAVRATLVHALLDTGVAANDPAIQRAIDEPSRWDGRLDQPMLLIAAARTVPRAQAVELLRTAGAQCAALGVDPPTLLPWRPALALVLADESPAEARALADEHQELAERLGTARARGIAQRTIAVLDRDPDGLRSALDLLDGDALELERARTWLALGRVLRRAGQRAEAREALHQSIAAAERRGAHGLAGLATEELRTVGGRPARASGDALTPAERRVVAMAATGASNPEIAAALFVGRRTVEMHLSRAYRKLGVRSRDELAAHPGLIDAAAASPDSPQPRRAPG